MKKDAWLWGAVEKDVQNLAEMDVWYPTIFKTFLSIPTLEFSVAKYVTLRVLINPKIR